MGYKQEMGKLEAQKNFEEREKRDVERKKKRELHVAKMEKERAERKK